MLVRSVIIPSYLNEQMLPLLSLSVNLESQDRWWRRPTLLFSHIRRAIQSNTRFLYSFPWMESPWTLTRRQLHHLITVVFWLNWWIFGRLIGFITLCTMTVSPFLSDPRTFSLFGLQIFHPLSHFCASWIYQRQKRTKYTSPLWCDGVSLHWKKKLLSQIFTHRKCLHLGIKTMFNQS